MSGRANKLPSALKHAAYSSTTLLPGEDPAAFEKLQRDLISELAPSGILEDDIVATIAHLVWRKQNLMTFRIAEVADDHRRKIASEVSPFDPSDYLEPSRLPRLAERQKAERAIDERTRKELSPSSRELLELDDIATVENLMKELEVSERLDGLIDRCLKRLLFLRGLKSISSTSSSTPPSQIHHKPKAA